MAGTAATNLANVNISETYYGVLHAGGQNLPPSGQAQIYDGYGTPTAIRVGANCNGVTICGPLIADSLTTTSGLSASTQFDIFNLLNVLHPVGSVIFTFNNDNPKTRSGWTSTDWTQISQGRFIVGVGTGTDNRAELVTFSPGNNYGEYNHILTINEMPSHNHVQSYSGGDRCDGWDCMRNKPIRPQAGGGQGGYKDGSTMNTAGKDQPHNNRPPSFGLYVWQRTA